MKKKKEKEKIQIIQYIDNEYYEYKFSIYLISIKNIIHTWTLEFYLIFEIKVR